MDSFDAISAFSALGHPTRLSAFRLLIKSGPEGMSVGQICESLNVRQNTMSTNLSALMNSGLISNQRQGRTIRYFVNYVKLRELLSFLMQDCCGGNSEICQPIIDQIAVECENG